LNKVRTLISCTSSRRATWKSTPNTKETSSC
jgi:hypothetical protein